MTRQELQARAANLEAALEREAAEGASEADLEALDAALTEVEEALAQA